MGVLWLAERSRWMRKDDRLGDLAACRVSVRVKMAVSVERAALKPDCLGSWRLFC